METKATITGRANFNLATLTQEIIRSGEKVQIHGGEQDLYWITATGGRRTRAHSWDVISEAVTEE